MLDLLRYGSHKTMRNVTYIYIVVPLKMCDMNIPDTHHTQCSHHTSNLYGLKLTLLLKYANASRFQHAAKALKWLVCAVTYSVAEIFIHLKPFLLSYTVWELQGSQGHTHMPIIVVANGTMRPRSNNLNAFISPFHVNFCHSFSI